MYKMYESINQSPGQVVRDDIDKELYAAGWAVQDKDKDKDKIDAHGDTGMMFQLFETEMNPIISEMNEALAV